LRKQKDDALEELAGLIASADLEAQPETNGRKIVVRTFSDRDINFAKLFAQKLTRAGTPAIALVASTVDAIGLVFAQSAGGSADMGALLKQVLSSVGGRAAVPAISLKAEFQRAHLSTSSSFCATAAVTIGA